jgi:hypothetical protein
MKKRFSEEQIILILKEADTGAEVVPNVKTENCII